jgi:hypothetical protein
MLISEFMSTLNTMTGDCFVKSPTFWIRTFFFFLDHQGDKNLDRKITKGAEVLKLIIEESLLENKHGLVTDRALQKAETSNGVSYTT